MLQKLIVFAGTATVMAITGPAPSAFADPSVRTIVPTEDGTRFTNDGTGHGMFVSIDNGSAF